MPSSVGSRVSGSYGPVAYARAPAEVRSSNGQGHARTRTGAGAPLEVQSSIGPHTRIRAHDCGKEAVELFEAFSITLGQLDMYQNPS